MLYLAATFFWLFSMTALLSKHYSGWPVWQSTSIANAQEALIPEEFFKEHWMGIYQGTEKIGYSSGRLEKTSSGYREKEYTFLRVRVMGVLKEIATNTDVVFDSKLKLQSIRFSMNSDVNLSMTGIVDGRELVIKIDGDMKVKEQRLPLKEDPYMEISLFSKLMSGGITEGKSVNMPIIEPSTLTQGNMELKVTGKETIMVIGKETVVYKLKGNYQGAVILAWITEKGEVVKEEAMGLVSVLEPKEVALNVGLPTNDLITGDSVKADKPIPDKVSYLKLKIDGIDFDGLEINGGSQILNANEVEITKLDPAKMTDSGLKVDDSFLKPTMFVQSDDPEIIAQANKIVGKEKNPLKKARLIYDWVYKKVKKMPAMTIPSATEVLHSMRGDCNEHTTLYVALARAVGLPTRITIGVVHKDGAFYYHAWPEVFINGWLPIDPTLGEFTADAGHLRLLTGDIDKQIRLVSIIGRLKLSVIEVR